MNEKDVLISVKPQYANLLVDGVKSVELRRKFSESLAPGTKCIIYSTSPQKKVIGHCKIDLVNKLNLDELWIKYASRALISWEDFSNYFNDLEFGFAIEVYGYTRYERPIDLDHIMGADSRPPQSYRYISNDFAAEI